MIARWQERELEAILKWFRVVNLTGARQSGKTTLTEMLSLPRVKRFTLDDDEIEYYIAKYRPMDKAGSYGAQEWIGYIGMSNIVGSYFNVMGLPVQRLYNELKLFT